MLAEGDTEPILQRRISAFAARQDLNVLESSYLTVTTDGRVL